MLCKNYFHITFDQDAPLLDTSLLIGHTWGPPIKRGCYAGGLLSIFLLGPALFLGGQHFFWGRRFLFFLGGAAFLGSPAFFWRCSLLSIVEASIISGKLQYRRRVDLDLEQSLIGAAK